jgi:transcriptional regulator with XRE-family HTH domain
MNPKRDSKQLQAIGQRLKDARIALGFSQKELYNRLGVGASTWHNWETGKRTPDPFVMVELLDLYGISLDWIYAGSAYKDIVAQKNLID